MGADHQFGVRPEGGLQPIQRETAVFIRRQNGQVRTAAVERAQHAVVVQCGGNGVPALCQQTGNGNVQRRGGISGEGHLLSAVAVEQPVDAAAGLVNGAPGSQAGCMRAPATVSHSVHGFGHRLHHAVGPVQTGGGVVQIDHGRTTRAAPISFSAMAYMLVTLPTASCSVRP